VPHQLNWDLGRLIDEDPTSQTIRDSHIQQDSSDSEAGHH